jgi:MFS family permease
MVNVPVKSSTVTSESSGSYAGPLMIVTSLFFMWGFLTCLNDILVPHLKSIFDLSYARVMLIQFAFFGAYFIFSIPSAKIIVWIGYQRSMVLGLLMMGLGAFLFVPAASVPSYPLFLGALIVLAAGITCLQVAANPYVTVLGKPETASSRLNLTQAFNSLGTFLAPFFGGVLILSAAPKAMDEIRAMAPDALQAYRLHEAATVKTPYVGLGIALVVLAIAIASFKLPTIEHAQHKVGEKVDDSIWNHPNLVFGAIAIFVYVGAEVSIGKFCRLLLGWRDGRAFHRFRSAAKSQNRAVARDLRHLRRGPGCNFDAGHRTLRHVEHHLRWFLQLHHVPEYFHPGCGRARPSHWRGLRTLDHGHRRRSHYSAGTRLDRRQDRNSSRLLFARDLLPLHPVFRAERIQTKQRAPGQNIDTRGLKQRRGFRPRVAATPLGLNRSTLHPRMKKLAILPSHYPRLDWNGNEAVLSPFAPVAKDPLCAEEFRA